MFVAFSDKTKTTIIALFGAPQDIGEFPNQDSVDSSDARYTAYIASLPPSAQAKLPPVTIP